MARQKVDKPLKLKKIDIRISEGEKQEIYEAAEKSARLPAKWIRKVLLEEARLINGK